LVLKTDDFIYVSVSSVSANVSSECMNESSKEVSQNNIFQYRRKPLASVQFSIKLNE